MLNVTDEPIRFPLPKNLVIIEFMEAAKQDKRKEDINGRDLSKEDVRISALLGCGTYIVKYRNGLQVFLTDPNEP